MSAQRLRLKGVSGLFAGESYLLSVGGSTVIGRSRSCDVSLARTRAFRHIGRAALERSRAFRRISRRHVEVVFTGPDHITVRDLSTNGTWVDGSLVREAVLTWDALKDRPVTITFGDGEKLMLTCGDAAESDFLFEDAEPRTLLETHSSSSHF